MTSKALSLFFLYMFRQTSLVILYGCRHQLDYSTDVASTLKTIFKFTKILQKQIKFRGLAQSLVLAITLAMSVNRSLMLIKVDIQKTLNAMKEKGNE